MFLWVVTQSPNIKKGINQLSMNLLNVTKKVPNQNKSYGQACQKYDGILCLEG